MSHQIWIEPIKQSFFSHRRMIETTIEQLSDDEFFRRPNQQTNSVAVILRHVAGNLASRWTNFLSTDGEKPDRDRDAEFQDWPGDKQSLLVYFDNGWRCLNDALQQATRLDPETTIYIRGEAQSLAAALVRSLAHTTYHVGQITMTARLVHAGTWKWMTIAPGESRTHNQKTWGTSASRAIFGADEPTNPNGQTS